MEQSALLQLIQSLSPLEIRETGKFLRSPFFNQRTDLCILFEAICKDTALDKEALWRLVVGPQAYDDQKFRLLQSYLLKLLEKYLAVKSFIADEQAVQYQLVGVYRQRKAYDAFDRARKILEKRLERSPARNAGYHEACYQLMWETHQLNYIRNPTDITQLRALSQAADIVYLAQKLRLVCLMAAHQSVYVADPDEPDVQSLLQMAERAPYRSLPAVSVYLLCYNMLTKPAEEQHFKQFKNVVTHDAHLFSLEEIHGLYILALNYCVRKINAGDERYYREVLDLYKTGLQQEYLLDNGVLSRFTYYNVVAAGLQTNELEWVRFFINEYKNRLEKKYRESLFSFNLARLEYAYKNYGYVLELLQHANYRDILLNLSAKTLLLKTYYELGERNALESHMDAMRNYIHRKRVIGYHRTNYLNILRYMEKLNRLNVKEKAAAEALSSAVKTEPVLSEKAFFLEKLGAVS